MVSVLIVNLFSEASLFDKRTFSLLQTSLRIWLRPRKAVQSLQSLLCQFCWDLATFPSPAPGTLFTAADDDLAKCFAATSEARDLTSSLKTLYCLSLLAVYTTLLKANSALRTFDAGEGKELIDQGLTEVAAWDGSPLVRGLASTVVIALSPRGIWDFKSLTFRFGKHSLGKSSLSPPGF